MADQDSITLTRAQIEELRTIIHNADSPLGNRLQDVSSRLYFALDGAGWTPAAEAAQPVAGFAEANGPESPVAKLEAEKLWLSDRIANLVLECESWKAAALASSPSSAPAESGWQQVLSLLRELEWSGHYFNRRGDSVPICPLCGGENSATGGRGHNEGCKIAAVIAAAPQAVQAGGEGGK